MKVLTEKAVFVQRPAGDMKAIQVEILKKGGRAVNSKEKKICGWSTLKRSMESMKVCMRCNACGHEAYKDKVRLDCVGYTSH